MLTVTHAYAQDDSVQTIANQFDKIYRTSSTYQDYKVISKDKYAALKASVLDSIKTYTKVLKEKEESIASKTKAIEGLKKDLKTTNDKLSEAISKENSFSVAGMEIDKGTYNLIVWVLMAILLGGLIYFIYQFSNSNIVTKNALRSLEEVEKEFDTHRKKTLEREQKLRRQLHDEINKNRNS
tara:strand:- start:48500 stop:49045 length:546 start_codon:yes stop_codon:yes gene_type:complete